MVQTRGQSAIKRAVVTGGCGFLGRWIAESLLEKGVQVVIFDRVATFESSDFEFVIGDLTKPEDCAKAFAGADTVFHVASIIDTNQWKIYEAVNIDGTRNVIDQCRAQGVTRLVYTSSPSVVYAGDDIENGDETLPIPAVHVDDYTKSKSIAERIVLQENGKDGLRTCAIRPHAMYGPRDNNLVPRTIMNAKTSMGKLKIGTKDNLSDFTYVENAALGHILAAEKLALNANDSDAPGGETYFITDDAPTSFWGFLGDINEGMGYPRPSITIPAGPVYVYAMILELIKMILRLVGVNFKPKLTRFIVKTVSTHHYFSTAKAKRDFGYKPKYSQRQGVEKTLKWWREQEAKNDKKRR